MPTCRYERYEIEYLIHFESGRFFCGSGLGSNSVDRVFLKDIRGNAIIPGTHLKGIVRQRCEELLSTLGGKVKDVHRGEGLERDTSLVARAFGAPGPNDVRCIFDDVIVEDEDIAGAVRKRVRMNRRLGRPEPHALFDTEYAVDLGGGEKPQVGRVTLWVEMENGEKAFPKVPPEVTLVCAGLRLVDGLGGDRSTGGGKVRIAVKSISRESGGKAGKRQDEAGGEELRLDDVLAPLKTDELSAEWISSGTGGAS